MLESQDSKNIVSIVVVRNSAVGGGATSHRPNIALLITRTLVCVLFGGRGICSAVPDAGKRINGPLFTWARVLALLRPGL